MTRGATFALACLALVCCGVDVFLTVDPANETALMLYERWGFSHRRFVPGYYRDNEDRCLLTRPARP